MTLEGTLETTVDGDVHFRFTVTNAGTDTVELTFHSGLRADLAVSEDGDVRWRWSDGRVFTQAVETELLEAGGRLEREFTWPDPPEGTFHARATLESEPGVEATTTVATTE